MFNNQQFYHEGIKKAVIAFGTIFNGLTIVRGSGATKQIVEVPLSYGPKQKFIARITEAPTLEAGSRPVEVVLPRMGFEITSISYDAGRALMQTNQVRNDSNAAFISRPYNIGFALSIFAKNQDDGLQIAEQILPHFAPDFNVTITEVPSLGIKRDLQLVLDGASYTEEYEGSFDQRLAVVWDLMFTMKINLWGNVTRGNEIRKVIQNLYSHDGLTRRITTTPLPTDAVPGSDYGFLQDFDSF